jgi:2-polyprenyl-3-methyl-5-hydroxy-6-metoxy-1,4-benzoquinol methylase
MDQEAHVNKIAALANLESYDRDKTRRYTDGTPHIKHAKLRSLHRKLVVEVYDAACCFVCQPKVLDLGAGQGPATLAFLELGARISAVDVSETQLDALRTRCS